jgi:hypothetical protein
MPNGSEGTEVDVQGLRTSLLTRGPSGQDEAVVFVHCSSGRGSDWELAKAVVPFLRAHATGCNRRLAKLSERAALPAAVVCSVAHGASSSFAGLTGVRVHLRAQPRVGRHRRSPI